MRNRVIIGSLGLALLIGLYLFSVTAYARQQAARIGQDDRRVTVTWQYAMLAVDGDMASFQAGENNLELEVLNVNDLYRRLGGTFRPNFTNLLNLIGRDGWELVTIEEGVYTFKRRR